VRYVLGERAALMARLCCALPHESLALLTPAAESSRTLIPVTRSCIRLLASVTERRETVRIGRVIRGFSGRRVTVTSSPHLSNITLISSGDCLPDIAAPVGATSVARLWFGFAVWLCCLALLFGFAVWLCCLALLFGFAVWLCGLACFRAQERFVLRRRVKRSALHNNKPTAEHRD